MKRDYESGESKDVKYFVGTEVEKTPAYGMRTLFVTGVQDTVEIANFAESEACDHVFFGANHSFKIKKHEDWQRWELMILNLLENGYLCSLDIDIKYAEDFLEGELVEHNNFIPQIRVPLPYIRQWNYNTMLKLDDKDFDASNPGVWCHSLHDLLDREKFTDWRAYGLDKILK